MNTIAVYGTLRMGEPNHGIIRGSPYLGDFDIRGFKMFSMGSFPALVPSKNKFGRITVEVYEVSDMELEQTDYLEGYPSHYNRTKIPIPPLRCEAWIYHYPRRSFENLLIYNKLIKEGDWVDFKKERGELQKDNID